MRRISHIAFMALSSVLLTSAVVASGCGDGTNTTSTGSGSGSSGTAGSGGIGGEGGLGGSGGGMGGTAGAGGSGGAAGAGGMAGAGGGGGSMCTPQMEVCDGLDNDCNNEVDEGCLCKAGDTQSCYEGDPSTANVGACLSGTQTCDLTGTFGACEGQVLPSAEMCNGTDDDCNGNIDDGLGTVTCGVGACQVTVAACEMGVPGNCEPLPPAPVEKCDGTDDDCDGQVDEGCSCVDGQKQSCYSGPMGTEGVGACAAGTQTCVNGQWGACTGDVVPTAETCNAIDDDCDTSIDEDLGVTVCGVGACQATVNNCVDGMPKTCVPGNPTNETCNGIDDDCDLNVDEGLGNTTCGVGACVVTIAACANGQPTTCVPSMPSPELCDGIDNDCNGTVDNGNPGGGGVCTTGAPGVCSAGVFQCTGGQVVCSQNNLPSSEVCDGLDNDCDGMVDDNAAQVGTSCTTNLPGVCAPGTRACTSGMLVCNPNVTASPEACDGLDNDCNGVVDNGNPGGGMQCNTGNLGICANGTTSCMSGQIACNQNTAPNTELCDGLDNDCDGMVDDNAAQVGTSCTTQQPGICSAGTRACTNGALVCNANLQPTTELCDGLDNDCDGTVDDSPATVGDPCTTGLSGVCSAGTKVCNNGMIGCSQTNQPTSEICDGLDNNCDGAVDNNPAQVGTACSTGLSGVCAAGVRACTGGSLVCNQTTQPSGEVCDGLDNDCDGSVDDSPATVGDPCLTGQSGVCSAGIKACTNGAIVCTQTTASSTEVCDGLDNDCNGIVDNGNPGGGLSCTTGQLGVCSPGTTACSTGAVICNRNVNPSGEVCDGLDNDCDGVVDDNAATVGDACSTGQQGVCAAGTKVCQNGAIVCSQTTQSSAEVCDGLDNDCDGVVDDNPAQVGTSCTTGLQGVCSAGTRACTNGSLVCNQTTQSSAEICDGLDNDCDGQNDEGNPGGGVSCSTGVPGKCSVGITACSAGAVVCTQTVFPVAEACDGQDNDCDGQNDEGNPGGGLSCNTGLQGVCSAGTTACSSGSVVCNQNTPASSEVCDGLDNNCNGAADDGNPGGGLSCNTGKSGICAAGTTACSSGAIACNQNNQPSSEICDGLDNDCDASVDEMDPNTSCSAQNPGAGGVASWTCPIGVCTVTGCSAGFANIDGAAGNGCECVTDTHANSCASAATANVAKGATQTMTGKVETANGSDWLTFTFVAPGALGQSYAPKLELTTNPGGQYAMDVLTDCATAATCNGNAGMGGTSGIGANIWQLNYQYNQAGSPPGPWSDLTAKVTSVKVRVYRKNGNAPTCDAYVVTATNP